MYYTQQREETMRYLMRRVQGGYSVERSLMVHGVGFVVIAAGLVVGVPAVAAIGAAIVVLA